MRRQRSPLAFHLPILLAFFAGATMSIADKVNGQDIDVLGLTNDPTINYGAPSVDHPYAAFTNNETGVKQINWIDVLDYPNLIFHQITNASEPQVAPDIYGDPPTIVLVDSTNGEDNVTGDLMVWDPVFGITQLTSGPAINRDPKIHADADSINVVWWTSSNDVYICELYNCIPQKISEEGSFAKHPDYKNGLAVWVEWGPGGAHPSNIRFSSEKVADLRA